MSSSIIVYALDARILKGIYGVADAAVLDAWISGNELELGEIDEETRELVEDEAMSGFLSAQQALSNIVNGAPMGPEHAYVYAGVYRIICENMAFGRFEDWVQFPGAAGVLGDFQKELSSAGIDVDVLQLVFCGSPVGIPLPDEGISFGYWDPGTVRQYCKQLAKLSGWRSWRRKKLGTPASEMAAEISSWAQSASRRREGALVGFYN